MKRIPVRNKKGFAITFVVANPYMVAGGQDSNPRPPA